MRCGIVKMHYRSRGTCTSPAVQDLGRKLEYLSQKYPRLNIAPGRSQSMKIARWMLRNTVNMIFRPLSYVLLLLGLRWPIDTIFAGDYNVAETMTPHWSRYHGSRRFAVVQACGVTVLRLTFAAAHWLMSGEPNEAKNFKMNLFPK
jgi:hypothetical protein